MIKRLNDLTLRCCAGVEVSKMRFKNLLRDETGAGTVEYALLCGVVVVGVISAFNYLFDGDGDSVLAKFFKAMVTRITGMLNGTL